MAPSPRAAALGLSLLALAAAGCGDSTTATPSADESAAVAAADTNIDALETSDDVRLVEVLDVTTGDPATLASTVEGDRPVLLWFWAPH